MMTTRQKTYVSWDELCEIRGEMHELRDLIPEIPVIERYITRLDRVIGVLRCLMDERPPSINPPGEYRDSSERDE